MNYLKLVVVGDNLVGKTCLLISHVIQKFPEYIPTNFDPGSINIKVGDDIYCLALFEASSQPVYQRFRPLTYPQTNIFVICFSVGSHTSFQNVQEKWLPELQHYCPVSPFIVVATQIDLRADEQTVQNMARGGQLPVTTAQGEKLARDVGAAKYVECSAKTLEGVASVFDEAVAAALNPPPIKKKPKRTCLVL